MTAKTPIRTVFDGSNNATGLAEFQSGEFIGLTHGGLGASLSIGTAGQVLKVNSGATALEFGNAVAVVDIDGATDLTGATLVAGDQILISDGGTEGRVTLSQIDTLFTSTTQTLTNKTIDTANNTITIVEADISDLGSYITASSTDTLTNKTIDTANNTITIDGTEATLSNIGNSSLTNSSITVTDGTTSTATSLGGTITFSGTANEVEVGESSGTITIGLPNDVTIGNDLIVSGNLTVNGTTTTVNSTTLTVDDKNIELGSTASPTDTSADGGGITLKGTTDKTFNWVDSTDSWTSSEHLDLATGKEFKINSSTVLTSSQVLGKSLPLGEVIGSSDTQTLTNKTINSDSNTITITESNISDLQSYITASSTDTLTNKTFDANGTGNSITNIEVADLASGVLDIDLTSVSASDDTLASAKAIKAYVDSQVTAQDLDFQGDSGGALSIDLDSETLTIAGGTGIDTTGSSNTITVAIDSSVTTNTGTQTLTNKTIDTANNTITIVEADISDLGSYITASSTDTLTNKTIDTANNTITITEADISDLQSYITASSTDTLTNKTISGASNTLSNIGNSSLSNSSITVAGDSGSDGVSLGETLTIAGGTGLTSTGSSNTITIALDNTTVTSGSYGSSTAIPTFTVDAQGRLTAASTTAISSDMSIAGDTGTDTITVGTDTFTIAGGTGLTSTATTDTITLNIDSTVVTLTDTQTLINKTLTSPDINAGTIDGATINGGTIGASTAVTELQVDNININGNSITSTNTNGNLSLSPDGSGTIDVNSAKITSLGTPTVGTDAATKAYVDTIAAAGIHYHDPVRVESPTNLNATYDNGTAGVGATLTNAGTQVALSIDGVTLSLNDRVLIYAQTNAAHNGIYYVSDTGSGASNWELTRTTDADSYGASDPDAFGQGDAFFVKEGDTGAGELYVMNTEGTITFGTTNITFTQVAETAVYSAGAAGALTLTGTAFSANVDDSTIEISSNALQVKDSGITASQLATNSVTTAKITDANVTAAKLAATLDLSGKTITLPSSFTTNTDSQTLTNKTINTASNTITIVEADISDLQSYITASSTDTLTNKTINSASNTITITESNISDLGAYITASSTDTLTNKSGNISQWTNDSGYLTSFTETNDLSSAVTWANVPDANITQSSVTQHQAALSITESQISDLGTYLENISEDTTPQLGGNLDAQTNNITNLGTINTHTIPGGTGTIALTSDITFTASSSDTLTNKTFDANGTGNSITNIEVADLASGVLDIDLTSVSASDDTLASAKAIKAYVDASAGGGGLFSETSSGIWASPSITTATLNGDLVVTGDVTSNSDERLKDNIETITSALDKVNALRGVYYDKDNSRHVGLIAQEVEKVLPEVVMTASDEMETKSIAYGNIVGLLIEALKEQNKRIEDLTKKVNNMKGV